MLFSMYDYILERPDGYCIFNTLNTKYVKINNEDDVKHFEELLGMPDLPIEDPMVKELYDRGFVVENDLDEYAKAKNIIDEIDRKRDSQLACLVYVTDQCNFRCVYCPEAHLSNNLPDSKWNALYKYIERSIEKENKKSVKIDFFGGEPLLQINKILEFLEKMKVLSKKHSVEMDFHFTSNGYLLTPEIYDKLVKLDFSYFFQITLDGFAEQHDKSRPLANGAGSWAKIVENLKYINTIDDKTRILLRTNIGPENQHILKEFHEWANATFTNKKFKFHIERVGRYSDRVDEAYVYNNSLEDLVSLEIQASNTVNTNELLGFGILSAECHVAKKGFFTLAVNGNVYKCENNYLYDEFHDIPIGHLNDDGEITYTKDIKELETYEYEKCETCKIYPICAGRTCPIRKIADPVNREDCTEKGMAYEYRLLKKIESGVLDSFEEKNLFVKK